MNTIYGQILSEEIPSSTEDEELYRRVEDIVESLRTKKILSE